MTFIILGATNHLLIEPTYTSIEPQYSIFFLFGTTHNHHSNKYEVTSHTVLTLWMGHCQSLYTYYFNMEIWPSLKHVDAFSGAIVPNSHLSGCVCCIHHCQLKVPGSIYEHLSSPTQVIPMRKNNGIK